jgi:hypothetical protein
MPSKTGSSSKAQHPLDLEWTDWHKWASAFVKDHSREQVASVLADIGQQINDLRRGMAAEAFIIDAQILSLSPRALGKGRREIMVAQVKRMLGCALAEETPRQLVRGGPSWSNRVLDGLGKIVKEIR